MLALWLAAAVKAVLGDHEIDTPMMTRVVEWLCVGVGVYGLVGTLAMDAWIRRRTWYGLTSSRLMIDGPRRSGGFRAFAFEELPPPKLLRRRFGETRATICFPPLRPWWTQITIGRMGSHNFRILQPSLDATPQLLGIADAAKVMRLLAKP